MSRKKKPKLNEPWASTLGIDNFGTMYDSMMRHSNYQKLSIGARDFYTKCRVQSRSKNGRACLYKHGEKYGRTYTDKHFVFPAKHLEEYGVNRSNANKYLKQLEEAGFIEVVERNQARHGVNVYAFSEKWKDSS